MSRSHGYGYSLSDDDYLDQARDRGCLIRVIYFLVILAAMSIMVLVGSSCITTRPRSSHEPIGPYHIADPCTHSSRSLPITCIHLR